jgi:hypothetical protein
MQDGVLGGIVRGELGEEPEQPAQTSEDAPAQE